jgi:catechol 2,3-dioxygenase-like lactoylglutathione lyase family enzyme
MPIEHLGLGVPDVDAARAYYDELMPLLGFVREWDAGYRPTDWQGAQIFLYPTLEDGDYSRHRIGLQHISFDVPTRSDVHRVYGVREFDGSQPLTGRGRCSGSTVREGRLAGADAALTR